MGGRGLIRSVKVVSRSVTVCRRVGGFCKGSKEGLKVLRESVIGVRVKGKGFVQVCICIYNFW